MILVVGATGELGGRIARRLVGAGERVMALVRPASDATALVGSDIEVVRGDLRDAESLLPAVTGVDTVVTTANAIGRMMKGASDLTIAAVDGTGNRNLIRAAEQAGVRRFVFVSAAGMGREMARLAPLMAAKWEAEKALRSTSMRSVLVRPDMFQERWLSPAAGIDARSGRALIYGRGRTPQRYVATDDVAALCAHLAVVPEPPDVVEFGGPEALTRREVVAAFEAATGRSFRIRRVPRVVLSAGRRALVHLRPGTASVLGLALFFDGHAATWDDKPLRDAGIVPRTVGAYIETTLAGAL